MTAGHLEVKNGKYFVVISYQDEYGKRHRKQFATGLPEKGSRRAAEAELSRIKKEFKPPHPALSGDLNPDMLFADYLIKWVEIAKMRIKLPTYCSYKNLITSTIAPYFRERGLTLAQLQARHIQSFYAERLQAVKPNTVIHYHAVIHAALKYAFKMDMVVQNVAMKVERPRKNSYQPVFLDGAELEKLFQAIHGTKLELPVLVAAFYGLRRSEVLGLKWDAIDFERGCISIRRTVTTVNLDGKHIDIEQDSAKTKSSLRTLPLVGSFKEYFRQVKEAQELNKKICGSSYDYSFDGFVFVDELGKRMHPNYLTTQFPKFAEKHGLPRLRFHDLRHSCASLLLANGVPLKQIQEWLGHSDFSTTANIYAHLDYSSKISSAQAMENGLTLPATGRIYQQMGGTCKQHGKTRLNFWAARRSLKKPVNRAFADTAKTFGQHV